MAVKVYIMMIIVCKLMEHNITVTSVQKILKAVYLIDCRIINIT